MKVIPCIITSLCESENAIGNFVEDVTGSRCTASGGPPPGLFFAKTKSVALAGSFARREGATSIVPDTLPAPPVAAAGAACVAAGAGAAPDAGASCPSAPRTLSITICTPSVPTGIEEAVAPSRSPALAPAAPSASTRAVRYTAPVNSMPCIITSAAESSNAYGNDGTRVSTCTASGGPPPGWDFAKT